MHFRLYHGGQTLKVLKGTETKYSWKKAEVKKTIVVAKNLEFVDLIIGMYKWRTAQR